MNCFDCKIPCEYSNPLGYCYKEQSGLPNGPWDKGYQPSGTQDHIKEAAINLADAVDGIVDAIERLKSVLLDLKKIKENKND